MTDETEVEDEVVETPDHEAKAREMGWRPKEEFKGDETRWVDAKTFVERAEESLPLAKATIRQLEKKIAGMERTFAEFKVHHSKTEQRAYQKAMADLEAQLEAHTEAGDVEGVKATAREITDLTKEMAAPQENGEPPEFTEWKEDNAWFEKDAVMRGAAIAIVDELIADGVTDIKKQIKEVDKRIRAVFPHKFENPRRKDPAAVEGAANAPKKAGKSRSDLPADARATMDRWIKQGLITEAQYLKEYQW